MSATRVPTRRLAAIAPVFLVAMALGGGVAGCGGSAHTSAPAAPAMADEGGAAAHEVPMGGMVMPTADQVEAAWATRPAYVTALPDDWQAAYHFAVARPDVLQWLPCYCGCGGMGHGSNLDCFVAGRGDDGAITWEEHASYCDICVDTANLAASMLRDGSTMSEIRGAVDATFSGSAPGTDTPLPPA